MTDNLKYLVALAQFQKFGPQRIKKIKNYFSDYKIAFYANVEEFKKAGIEENIAFEFIAQRINIIPDKIIEDLNNENISIIIIDDNNYPKLLSEIYYPPQLLYYKGRILKEEFSIAIVGTRKFTIYGKQIAEEFSSNLANNNLTIISGLAIGIDAIAHDSAIKAGARTIAVLGSGLDKKNIYPSSNRYLAEKIVASGGAIISEFPIGTPPLKHHFPQRNRIIAGLSLGVLVVEAAEKSGALITARFALEQNREVFAIPGNIKSLYSFGPNNLIKQGAIPVTSPKDILNALDLGEIKNYISNKKIIPETKEENMIYTNLNYEPKHIDELIKLTGLNTSVINSTLTIMEMKGIVKNLGGMKYVIKN